MNAIEQYDRARDLEAVTRIWREVGWVEDDREEESLALFLDANDVTVGMLEGEAECAVASLPGAIRYEHADLPLCIITAVTTSHIGRKHGFATTMTANALRAAADAGAAVATLGMFEQGFYDRLGFGTGSYQHQVVFDPSTLAVGHVRYRQPVRIGDEDYEEIHALQQRRHRRHGGVTHNGAGAMRAELGFLKKPFGLGYRDESGRLTHAILGDVVGEHGPYKVRHIAYEEPGQLLELLRLLRELGDQVSSVQMMEPPEIQLQDLIRSPFSRNRTTKSSQHATGIASIAFTQLRIVNLDACVGARRWQGPAVACNVRLTDPIADIAPDPAADAGLVPDSADRAHGPSWNGVGGDYVLHIGDPSTISVGHDPSLPTIAASIGAFSRCWFGVRPASSLALTDDLDAPSDLLTALDDALVLPTPQPGWDY